MKRLNSVLVLCLFASTSYAAITGGLRVNYDTSGTNTTGVRVTVSTQTNLNAGAVFATNKVTVGQTGEAGIIDLSSTNGTYVVSQTVDASGTFVIYAGTTNMLTLQLGAAAGWTGTGTNFLSDDGTFKEGSGGGGGGDSIWTNNNGTITATNTVADVAGYGFTMVSSNTLTSGDLTAWFNGTNVNPAASIGYEGSIYGRRLYVEDSWGSDFWSRLQPGSDLTINAGTATNKIVLAADVGTMTMQHEGTNTFHVIQDSGYTGGGTLFLSDDGTYKTVGSSTNMLSVSNFFATNIYSENIYVSNLYATNIYVTDITVTNTFISKGNSYNSNLYTLNLVISNSISGTIDPSQSGLILKQIRSLKLQYPRRNDGAGCTYSNTNDPTAVLFMVPRFSAAGATNANWCQWAFRVPEDIDTTVAMRASLTVQLAGADTSAATYTVGVVSIANSSAGAGTPANYVTLTIPSDGSGASGDIESVNGVTLTGWAAALTANQWALVQLQRDGSDASAVAQDALELEIFYTSSQ